MDLEILYFEQLKNHIQTQYLKNHTPTFDEISKWKGIDIIYFQEDLRKIGFFIGKFIYIMDAYEDVEEEVFDKIRNRSFYGDYSVIVTLEFQDSYGNYYDGPPVTVGSLNGAEVKRYASYWDFNGSSHIADAFPWNHEY